MTSVLDQVREVADAILYEGYLLYPYRRSAAKNHSRFQFGVLMPPAYREVDDREPSASQTECLLECRDDATVTVHVRFLRLRRRTVEEADPKSGAFHPVADLEAAGARLTAWDEASERSEQVSVSVADLLSGGEDHLFELGGDETSEPLADAAGRLLGRLVRRRFPLSGAIRLTASRLPGPCRVLRLRLRIENRTEAGASLRRRDEALPFSMIATHSLIWAPGGAFLSLTDPPEWAAPFAAECVNTATWPVLAGPPDCREIVLSSPVILYDHPQIAAESPGELFDGTEIDELLTLRTLTLTDEEKREARATDPRAAALLDRVDHLPPEMLERLHGAIRQLGPPGAAPSPATETPVPVPWWDPGSDTSVSPESDQILIAGAPVGRGSRVVMRPGARRADAQDLFLAGRIAVVEAVLHDVDGNVHLALTPQDDPAADVHRAHGRFRYFAPDEVEPLP